MAIIVRKGTVDKFDKNKLLPGELAVVINGGTYGNGAMYFCASAGNVKEIATREDLQSVLDASETSYAALQQLIADLENNPSELTNILANISNLSARMQSVEDKTLEVGSVYPTVPHANQIFYKIL
jgi:hypothetical protein